MSGVKYQITLIIGELDCMRREQKDLELCNVQKVLSNLFLQNYENLNTYYNYNEVIVLFTCIDFSFSFVFIALAPNYIRFLVFL